MTLEEFILSETCNNAYIKFHDLNSYHRKGRVLINDTLYRRVLTRANTSNRKRSDNLSYKDFATSTGLYRKLDVCATELVKKYGFDGIFVENVLNDFLPNKLLEMGYIQVNLSYMAPCFWKRVRDLPTTVIE